MLSKIVEYPITVDKGPLLSCLLVARNMPTT